MIHHLLHSRGENCQAHLTAAIGIGLVNAILDCRIRLTRGLLEAGMDKAVQNMITAMTPFNLLFL